MGEVVYGVDFRAKTDAKRHEEAMEELAKAVMGLIDMDWEKAFNEAYFPDKEPA